MHNTHFTIKSIVISHYWLSFLFVLYCQEKAFFYTAKKRLLSEFDFSNWLISSTPGNDVDLRSD